MRVQKDLYRKDSEVGTVVVTCSSHFPEARLKAIDGYNNSNNNNVHFITKRSKIYKSGEKHLATGVELL
jgi:hypothetical protein